MTHSRRAFVTAAGAVGVIGLAGCTSNTGDNGSNGSKSTNEILIGSHHPLSGPTQTGGVACHQGVKLALEEKNNDGGIQSLDGATLKLIKEDHQGAQENGAPTAQRLLDQGAVAIVGGFGTPPTLSGTQVTEQSGVPYTITVGVSTQLVRDRDTQYSYLTNPDPVDLGGDVANEQVTVLREFVDVETVGTLTVDNQYGQSCLENYRSSLPEADVEIIVEESHPLAPDSLTSQIERLRNSNPDVVMMTNYGAGAATAFNTMKSLDYRPVIGGMANPLLQGNQVESFGIELNGVISQQAVQVDINKKQDLAESFKNVLGEEPAYLSATADAYAATSALIKAIDHAGSDDPEDINSAMTEITDEEHPLPQGPTDYNENGVNQGASGPLTQVIDGQKEIVHGDHKTADAIHPLPSRK